MSWPASVHMAWASGRAAASLAQPWAGGGGLPGHHIGLGTIQNFHTFSTHQLLSLLPSLHHIHFPLSSATTFSTPTFILH